MQPASTTHRWRARVGTTLAALFVGLGLQMPAFAKKDTREPSPPVFQMQREAARPYAGVSLDKIITAAEKRHGASVVKWEETTVQGRKTYVLRLRFKDGRVTHIKVDAETGREL
jgi:uncharacterized membrane protein YkoI